MITLQEMAVFQCLMIYSVLSFLQFTVVKLKKRPANPSSVSYDMGSCSFTPVTAFLKDHNYACHSDKYSSIVTMHVIQIK